MGLWAYGRDTYPGDPLPHGVLPHLRNVGLWEATTDQDWGLDWHRNEGVEFTCVLGGRTAFSCDDRDFDLPTGTVTLTRPWQLHRVGRPNITASTLCWFILDVGVRRPNQDWRWPSWLPIPESDLARITDLLRHNEHPVWPATKGLLQAVEKLDRTLRGETTQPLARVALSISEILIGMAVLLEHHRPALDPYLSSTERMVDLFLTHLPERLEEPWTVRSMANECGIGRTRFVHYCKLLVNLPPLEYLTHLRAQRACWMLTNTTAKMSDIAFSCGFQSSQYFSTVFRRYVGVAPTEYRTRISLSDPSPRVSA